MRRDLIALGLLLGVLISAAPARAAAITFASRDVTLGVCETPDCSFTVDLFASDFTDPFIGLVLNFTFDSSVLSLASISEGAFLLAGGPGGFDASPLPGAGFQTITKVVGLGLPPIGGSGLLATLTFIPSGPGTDVLRLLADGVFGDGTSVATEYLPEVGDPARPALISGVINVQNPQAVPEPGTLGLLGVGLLAMARRLRRRVPARRT
jgi:hypothetical protein